MMAGYAIGSAGPRRPDTGPGFHAAIIYMPPWNITPEGQGPVRAEPSVPPPAGPAPSIPLSFTYELYTMWGVLSRGDNAAP